MGVYQARTLLMTCTSACQCDGVSSVCLARAEFLHVKPGKGAAFVRTKLKNYITGNVVERTFRGGESVDSATLDKKETQFSYVDGDDVSGPPVLPCCLVHGLDFASIVLPPRLRDPFAALWAWRERGCAPIIDKHQRSPWPVVMV